MAKLVPAWISTKTEGAALGLMQNNLIRGSAIRLADRAIWEFLKRTNNPPGMKRDEWLTLRGLMYSFDRSVRKGLISEQAARHVIEFAHRRIRAKNPSAEAFKERYGDSPPAFSSSALREPATCTARDATTARKRLQVSFLSLHLTES